jgi:hypothetical protein
MVGAADGGGAVLFIGCRPGASAHGRARGGFPF